ncbi:MAG: peptidase M23, partial [Bacteroidetes bacterium MED-G13]
MKASLFYLLLIVFISAKSQNNFDFPVELPIYLSGSFAELRPNHFHSGIDIKTKGKTGYKIFSLEDGYIQRIQITLGGNGKAIYIKHDNGQSSVYAHLENFSPGIQKIVKEIQYSEKKFEIRLFPKKNQYRIKKKELIGFSGNTGRSTGPHLHYEIRDKNDHPINPLKFKKERIKDTIPPIVKNIFYKQLFRNHEGLYENPKLGFKKLNLKKVNEKYISDTLKVSGIVGFGVDSYDKMNLTNNVMGINEIETFINNNKIFNMDFNRFSFNEWRHINTFIDYAAFKKNKLTIQKLFTTSYNPLEMYNRSLGDGSLDLLKVKSISDRTTHLYKILLYDFNKNI